MTRSYLELITLPTFEERLRYLMLYGTPFGVTFGEDRYLNQMLYRTTPEWQLFRREIILRDNGCDMALDGYVISKQAKLVVHHINPLTVEDVVNRSSRIFDPNNVVCVSFNTHQIIHFGNNNRVMEYQERTAGDTCPWR